MILRKKTDYDPVGDPEYDRRPWMTILGLVLAIACWIVIFIPVKFEEATLHNLVYVMLGVSVLSILLCLWGIKRAPMVGLIGILIAAMLLVTLLFSVFSF